MEVIEFPMQPLVEAGLLFNCCIVFLMLVVVSLRIVSRRMSGVGIGWDDVITLIAVVSSY
jgi:hypothetical protein